MSGMFALHCLSCRILFMLCILFEESFILSPIFSLVILRNFCRYFLFGMTVKSTSGSCFSILVFLNLSLHEDKFGFTFHAGTRCYFLFHKHVFVVFMSHFFQLNIYI
jgi:hypothetical protein